MKCVVCKKGKTHPGKATVTLEKGATTFVVKGVPANVCASCSEEYIDEDVAARILKEAEEAAKTGVQVNVRGYVAA